MTKDTKPIAVAKPVADTKRRLLGGTMLDRLGHVGITAAGLLYAMPAAMAFSAMHSARNFGK